MRNGQWNVEIETMSTLSDESQCVWTLVALPAKLYKTVLTVQETSTVHFLVLKFRHPRLQFKTVPLELKKGGEIRMHYENVSVLSYSRTVTLVAVVPDTHPSSEHYQPRRD